MQLSHVDISVPMGTLTDEFVSDLERLVRAVFAWGGGAHTVQQPGRTPNRAASYGGPSMTFTVHESAEGLVSGHEDHLGFLVDRDELDRLAAACAALSAEDGRFEIRYLHDGVPDAVDIGPMVFHTFFVRFCLPLWFQFELYEPKPEPEAEPTVE